MADHLALQAIRRMRDLFVALPTAAGSRVFLGAVGTVDPEDGQAIDLNIGSDSAQSEFGVTNTAFVDSVQRVYVDLIAGAKLSGEKMLEQLYLLRAQTHRALHVDYTLGLPFVISVRYQGTEELRDANGGLIVGIVRTVWDVGYRMNYTDPTT